MDEKVFKEYEIVPLFIKEINKSIEKAREIDQKEKSFLKSIIDLYHIDADSVFETALLFYCRMISTVVYDIALEDINAMLKKQGYDDPPDEMIEKVLNIMQREDDEQNDTL